MWCPGPAAAPEAWDTWAAELDRMLHHVGAARLGAYGLPSESVKRLELLEDGDPARSILRGPVVLLVLNNGVHVHFNRGGMALPPQPTSGEDTTR